MIRGGRINPAVALHLLRRQEKPWDLGQNLCTHPLLLEGPDLYDSLFCALKGCEADGAREVQVLFRASGKQHGAERPLLHCRRHSVLRPCCSKGQES